MTKVAIRDLYVRNSNDPTNGVDQAAVNAITFLRAPGMRVDNNVLINCGWCINGFGSGVEIDHNDVSRMDHGVASGCGGTCTAVTVHDNHFHDMGQWDTTSNAYHHDGIHFFSEGGSAQNVLIYNNLFDGSLGVNTTAWIFMEGVDGGLGIHGAIIFNNVLTDSLTSGKTMLWMEGHGASSNNAAYNNYFYDGHGSGLGMFIRQEGNFTAKNNIAGIVSYQSTTIGDRSQRLLRRQCGFRKQQSVWVEWQYRSIDKQLANTLWVRWDGPIACRLFDQRSCGDSFVPLKNDWSRK